MFPGCIVFFSCNFVRLLNHMQKQNFPTFSSLLVFAYKRGVGQNINTAIYHHPDS